MMVQTGYSETKKVEGTDIERLTPIIKLHRMCPKDFVNNELE